MRFVSGERKEGRKTRVRRKEASERPRPSERVSTHARSQARRLASAASYPMQCSRPLDLPPPPPPPLAKTFRPLYYLLLASLAGCWLYARHHTASESDGGSSAGGGGDQKKAGEEKFGMYRSLATTITRVSV